MKKFVRKDPKHPSRFIFAEDVYQQEKGLAGTRLYRTTLVDYPADQLHDGYQLLQEVEANHRELKSPMRLRPCYHRLTERIQAHVMINILAINCLRRLEHRTKQSAAELRELSQVVKAVEMRQGEQNWWQLTEIKPAFQKLCKSLQIILPPKTWPV